MTRAAVHLETDPAALSAAACTCRLTGRCPTCRSWATLIDKITFRRAITVPVTPLRARKLICDITDEVSP